MDEFRRVERVFLLSLMGFFVLLASVPASPQPPGSYPLETFLGLSGIGDIDLSCNSPQSRNMSLGIALGEGRRLAEVLGSRITVQEGVHSASAVAALARRLCVEMPIVAMVDRILNHGTAPDGEIDGLLQLPFGVEQDVVPWLRRSAAPSVD